MQMHAWDTGFCKDSRHKRNQALRATARELHGRIPCRRLRCDERARNREVKSSGIDYYGSKLFLRI